eukprot:Phypoly_transcript_05218.p1 GENE.Phypoly_transcript_05218~~Phypoly_transcript_05218.p1  ORF type:complete len:614 (+),score=68.76 Phypoly_transcript_05218:60-1844(+)
MKQSIVLLLIIYLAHASAKQVSINSTAIANCAITAECWFFDAALWVNGATPEQNDDVFISDVPTNNSLFLNSSIALSTLFINSDFRLIITGVANVSLSNLTLTSNAKVDIVEQAQVYGLNHTSIHNNSEIKVEAIAFAQAGAFFYLDESSSIWVTGYLGLHADHAIIRGDIQLQPNAVFASTGGIIEFVNKTYSFPVTPIIYNAIFVDSQITFPSGWRGSLSANLISSTVAIGKNAAGTVLNSFTVDPASTLSLVGISNCTLVNQNITGTLSVNSSNVALANLTAFGPLIIGGASTINGSSVHISAVSFQPGVNAEAPNLIVNADYVHVYSSASLDFPQATITALESAYFKGAIHLQGNINTAKQMYIEDSELVVTGDISIGFVNGNQVTNPSSLTTDQATISAVNIRLASFGTLTTNSSKLSGNVIIYANSTLKQQSTVFEGELHNYGFIALTDRFIVGNYTQRSYGTLLVYVDLATRSSGYLDVQGSAFVNGSLQYSIQSPPRSKGKIQLLLIKSAHGVAGSFLHAPQDVSFSDQHGSVLFTQNDIYLVFGKDKGKASIWWIWLIVAFGIIAVGALVFFLVRTWRRRKYFDV